MYPMTAGRPVAESVIDGSVSIEENRIMTAETACTLIPQQLTDSPADPMVSELVARAKDGDRQAWDALVERYAPLIWSICATVTGSASIDASTCQRALVWPAGRANSSPAAARYPPTRRTSMASTLKASPAAVRGASCASLLTACCRFRIVLDMTVCCHKNRLLRTGTYRRERC